MSRVRLGKNKNKNTHFQVSSVGPSAHCASFTFLCSTFFITPFWFLFIHLSFPSVDWQMIIWTLGSLSVLSAYSLYSTGLTSCLFPLFLPSSLLLPCLISPTLSCRRSSADNTGGGSGGPGLPGNFLTNHIAAVTCCTGLLLSVCTVGRQLLLLGYSVVVVWHVRVEVCSHPTGNSQSCGFMGLWLLVHD